jgi:hypothetical protein
VYQPVVQRVVEAPQVQVEVSVARESGSVVTHETTLNVLREGFQVTNEIETSREVEAAHIEVSFKKKKEGRL